MKLRLLLLLYPAEKTQHWSCSFSHYQKSSSVECPRCQRIVCMDIQCCCHCSPSSTQSADRSGLGSRKASVPDSRRDICRQFSGLKDVAAATWCTRSVTCRGCTWNQVALRRVAASIAGLSFRDRESAGRLGYIALVSERAAHRHRYNRAVLERLSALGTSCVVNGRCRSMAQVQGGAMLICRRFEEQALAQW
jgi:hypothetical protein